jgi:hypothetical protein
VPEAAFASNSLTPRLEAQREADYEARGRIHRHRKDRSAKGPIRIDHDDIEHPVVDLGQRHGGIAAVPPTSTFCPPAAGVPLSAA